ncbi:hypothetical protein, partial [Photobacterium sanctipauli]
MASLQHFAFKRFLIVSIVLAVAALTPKVVISAQEDVPYCHRYADFNFPDYMALWNYDDPETTASTFFAMLNMASSSMDKTFFSELLSQIARTFVMREQYEDANHFLEQAKLYLDNAEPRAEAYYLREKARLLTAKGQSEQATELLVESWHIADEEKYDQLAIETALDLSEAENISKAERKSWRNKALALSELTS